MVVARNETMVHMASYESHRVWISKLQVTRSVSGFQMSGFGGSGLGIALVTSVFLCSA